MARRKWRNPRTGNLIKPERADKYAKLGITKRQYETEKVPREVRLKIDYKRERTPEEKAAQQARKSWLQHRRQTRITALMRNVGPVDVVGLNRRDRQLVSSHWLDIKDYHKEADVDILAPWEDVTVGNYPGVEVYSVGTDDLIDEGPIELEDYDLNVIDYEEMYGEDMAFDQMYEEDRAS